MTEAHSASEASDLRLARVCSGFPTAVFSDDVEIVADELERLAEIDLRFR